MKTKTAVIARVWFASMLLALPPSVANAAVSCDDPDSLCIGDPCIIETLTVVAPCAADFGSRTVEIVGTVTVPDGGLLSLEAGSIRLTGKIDGRNVNGGLGASVTLEGNTVELDGAIDAGGAAGGGSVTLTGHLIPRGKIRATSKLGPGGTVALSGGSFDVQNTIDVRGASGGSIVIQGGSVQVGFKSLDARGLAGPGGSVTLAVADVTLFGNVDLRGKGGDGGTLTWTGRAHFMGKVDVSGTANGGSIASAGRAAINGKITARGKAGNGGTLTVSSPEAMECCGNIAFMRAKLDFRGALAGGLIDLHGDWIQFGFGLPIPVTSQFRVGGGSSPGEIRITHSGATHPLEIDANFDARESGVVELLAPNADLTVRGKALAGPAGCVGVSAGGTINTSELLSDVVPAPNCP